MTSPYTHGQRPPQPAPASGYAVPPAAGPLAPPYGHGGHHPYPAVPLAPNGQPLADFGHRLLAYLLDTVVVTVVLMVFVVPFYVWWILTTFARPEAFAEPPPPATTPEPPLTGVGELLLLMAGLFAVILAITAVVTYVYHVEMMFRSGQTLGKRVVKLQVVPLDGGQLTRGQAAKRWLVQWGGGTFIPFFSYLDGFWQLWDKPLRQCLHDKLPRTVVVKLPADQHRVRSGLLR